MSASLKSPSTMTVPEFLAWDASDGRKWQLIDGVPYAMAPANRTHSHLQSEVTAVLVMHLRETGRPCTVGTEAGIVPLALPSGNFRIPDLAVTCTVYTEEESILPDPVLIVEILSPSNAAETWTNVWAYTSIPSVHEILVLHTTEIGADLLRRDAGGAWPQVPTAQSGGDLVLESVGLTIDLPALYRTTRLATA